jgi:hypothetical protein
LRIPHVAHVDDLALLDRLMGGFPALGSAQGWAARFSRELNASDDRANFGTSGLPVIEGKHLEPFRTNAADTVCRIRPDVAARLLPDARYTRPRLGYRDVSGVANMRSLIAAVVPANVVTTHTVFCLRTEVSLEASYFLCGVFNSFVMNFVARMLMGSHITTSLAEQIPVPAWPAGNRGPHISRLAQRLATRSERCDAFLVALEGEVARLYGVNAVEFDRIVKTFPLVPSTIREQAVDRLRRLASKADS